MKRVSGFSKLSKQDKLSWLNNHFLTKEHIDVLRDQELSNASKQEIIESISENVVSNFHLPFAIAPNFLINRRTYCLPMVIEESSVVAAASSAAKFWSERGGFYAEVRNTKKEGQIHFQWEGPFHVLQQHFDELTIELQNSVAEITSNMRKRGGGILRFHISEVLSTRNLFKLQLQFDTKDSMGANFINTVLEKCAMTTKSFMVGHEAFRSCNPPKMIMSILSNYTPECLVEARVECKIDQLSCTKIAPEEFADKFSLAVEIAKQDVYRAVTHNKGIFNGIDAIAIATGNDFRAIEACGHAYASRFGQYQGLSDCSIQNDIFSFSLKLPLAIGVVGGLTSTHPLAALSLKLLGNPDAETLMEIMCVAGLAQNFAALKSLVTTGIQQGHMKMHLTNILKQLGADIVEKNEALTHFQHHEISFHAVRQFLDEFRGEN